LLAFEVGGTSAALPSVASFADLSAENARAVVAAGGALIAPELAEADSDGAFGATIAAGLCSGVCAKLGAAVRHAAPITVADRAAMTIRGLIQGLLFRKVLIWTDPSSGPLPSPYCRPLLSTEDAFQGSAAAYTMILTVVRVGRNCGGRFAPGREQG
jgi:hypothetical protein